MLTPIDIAEKKFEKSAFGAYKPEDVDEFLDEVLVSYKEAYAEKEAAEDKLEVLAEKLEEYRTNEDSIKTVLMGAQKLGDNIVRDAKAKAEVILSEAKDQAGQIFSETETRIIKEKETLITLQKETSEFKKHLLAIYKQHLEQIGAMPEYSEEKEEASETEEETEKIPETQEIQKEQEEEASSENNFDDVSMAETRTIELDIQE